MSGACIARSATSLNELNSKDESRRFSKSETKSWKPRVRPELSNDSKLDLKLTI